MFFSLTKVAKFSKMKQQETRCLVKLEFQINNRHFAG